MASSLIHHDQGGAILGVDAGGYITRSTATPAAAGNSLATATVLAAEINFVTGADSTKGVSLPVGVAGMEITIKNNTAGQTLNVYGAAAGVAINAIGAGSPISMAALASAVFRCASATQWHTIPTLPS